MKSIWLLMFSAIALTAAEPAPAAFPSEIKLTNGATLHNTTATRFEREQVVVKHAGGLAPIRYENIAEPYRHQVLAARDAQPKKNEPPQASEPEHPFEFHGQVFIATRGAGSYKFGGIPIIIYAATREEVRRHRTTFGGVPELLRVTTNADGEFFFTLPPEKAHDKFTIFAEALRYVPGQGDQRTIWAIECDEKSAGAPIILSNDNEG
jgi:hypothetical protein